MASDAPVSSPTLNVEISKNADGIFAHCRGRLTFENTAIFRREIWGHISNKGRLTLDLSDVTRMDSAGLGVIVGLYVAARKSGCRLELVNLNKQIRDLLSMSRFLEVFEAYGASYTSERF